MSMDQSIGLINMLQLCRQKFFAIGNDDKCFYLWKVNLFQIQCFDQQSTYHNYFNNFSFINFKRTYIGSASEELKLLQLTRRLSGWT